MSIRVYSKTAKIMDGDEEIAEVRGLSPNDFFELYTLHKEAMEDIYNRFVNREPGTISEEEVMDVAGQAIQYAPKLMAHLIAIGANARDQFEDILAMPIGYQIDCVSKIVELTFAGGYGPKKILALVGQFQRTNQSQ
jgi:hypothetical protein